MFKTVLSLLLITSITKSNTYVQIKKEYLNYYQVLKNGFKSHYFELNVLDEDQNSLCKNNVSFYTLNCDKNNNEWKIFTIFNMVSKKTSKMIYNKLSCSDVEGFNTIKKKLKYNLLKSDKFTCDLKYVYRNVFQENEKIKDDFYEEVVKDIFDNDEINLENSDREILLGKAKEYYPDNKYLDSNVFVFSIDVYDKNKFVYY